jgi:hypothetical protein
MKLTNEAKRDILDFVLGRVAAIADIKYQKRVWIQGEGPEVDDFDETVNNYSSDAEGILEHYKDFGITETQFQILRKFDKQFRDFYGENDWPHEFIDTPEWEKITQIAREVLEAFNYKKARK